MLQTVKKQSSFVTDGVKLAQTQIVVNRLVPKLSNGRFWSAEDVLEILEASAEEIKKILAGQGE